MSRLLSMVFAACLLCDTAMAQSTASNGDVAVKLGTTLPLSGDLAPYGYLIRDGIELAIDDLRSEGYKVSIVYEDVPSPGPVALTAIQRLTSIEHINGLAANFWNPVIPIIAGEIMRNNIIAFHTAAADDVILQSGDLIFCTNARIRDEAYHIAEYARNKLNAKTASVLYIATNFGDSYQKHFIKRFEELGGKILMVDNSKLNESDIRPQLLRVLYKKADVFFAAYFGTNLGLVLKQAGQLGIKQQTLGVYEADDPSVLEVGGVYANGLRFFVAEGKHEDSAFQRYHDKFVSKYHYEPRILGSNAYDATHILVKALAECKLDTQCAKKRIHRVKNYEGASGKFSIDADGATTKDFVLRSVENGQFVYK